MFCLKERVGDYVSKIGDYKLSFKIGVMTLRLFYPLIKKGSGADFTDDEAALQKQTHFLSARFSNEGTSGSMSTICFFLDSLVFPLHLNHDNFKVMHQK